MSDDQPQAHGVRIAAQPGHASIRLDGQELPGGQVTGYTLHHSIADSLPTLVLHTRQPEGAVWEGLARVAVAVDKPVGQVITAFLAQIDPTELDRAALNRSDYGGGKGAIARAMLQTLAEWAQEVDG
ncbi:hypothetical protein [Streptomyces nigrescens]|uniref:hypothetical protein n=1 Tax=Streptomyces nigrescens TaxID=1920 RepID=UPI0036F94FF6